MKIMNYADTIAQFKILQYIKKNYVYEAVENGNLKLEKISRSSLKITDINGDSLVFSYDLSTGKITEIEVHNTES